MIFPPSFPRPSEKPDEDNPESMKVGSPIKRSSVKRKLPYGKEKVLFFLQRVLVD